MTCISSGNLKKESISCKSSELCKVQNGLRGCYPRQCLLEADSFNLFSGETLGIMSVGAFELVRVCDTGLEAEWFRVVVELGSYGNQNSVVAVYVYFEEVFITVTRKQDTWVCILDQITFSYILYFWSLSFKALINQGIKIYNIFCIHIIIEINIS